MELFKIYLPDGALMSTETLISVVCLLFLYTFVGIVAGFGGALVTMPLMTLIIPVKVATPISVTVGTITAAYAIYLDRKSVDWKSAISLILSAFIGIPLGLYALKHLPDHFMKAGLGIFLIVYSVYSLIGPKLPKVDKPWLPFPFGLLAGALGAAFSTSGPPVVVYGTLRDLAPSTFRGTLSAFFMTNNIAIMTGMITSGILNLDTLKIVLIATPVLVSGSLIGNWIHKKISKEKLRKIIFGLLIFSGIMLLRGILSR